MAADRLVEEMDFTFLYDRTRDLFSIGYRPAEGILDPGYYDMLASEARLASFVAIARGDVPTKHWFRLGRTLTPVGRGSALVSWSGSMFEYLMPDLVLDPPTGSLLERTNHLAVRRQIQYGLERGVPWGISEAAYNARDLHFTYQYMNFGVSGLGLKRGLAEDLVVAPYATALAAMVEPEEAARNFERLKAAGALGRFGFYESIDYTASRLPEGEPFAIVRAYMAHHQGMTIVSLANVVLEETMRRRFGREAAAQATELLLQERTPRTVAVARPRLAEGSELHVRDEVPPVLRRFRSPHDPTPRTHLLSNGRYTVMVTAAGSGFSRWNGLDVTRWREDATRDPWGSYLFLSDEQSGRVWSAGYQPSGIEPDAYEAVYSEDRVEIHRPTGRSRRACGSWSRPKTTRRCARCPDQPRSARRARSRSPPTRRSCWRRRPRTPRTRRSPTSSSRRSSCRSAEALLASRRPRDRGEPRSGRRRSCRSRGRRRARSQYETDRARFLGRGKTIRDPISIEERPSPLEYGGTVLDPDLQSAAPAAVRRPERRPACIWRPWSPTRERRCSRWPTSTGTPRLTTGSRASPGRRRRSSCDTSASPTDEAHLFQRLATRILYSDAEPARSASSVLRNRKGPSRSGPTESPATCPSCSSGSTRSRTRGSCASSCAPTSTGG